MNLSGLWAQLEEDKKWRQDEIRLFQNTITELEDKEEQNQFRRPLVLLLYAHFEGFCKFAFTLYVNAVNNEQITCNDADYAIVAATLDKVFGELRNPERQAREFHNTAPDDRKLHRFARDREFLERMGDFTNRRVVIPEKIVDTESNLKPVVLQKILYRLGFPHDKFQRLEGKIHYLLEMRNKIGHGETRTGMTKEQYEELRAAAYYIMDEITRDIMNALQNQQYLRKNNHNQPSASP